MTIHSKDYRVREGAKVDLAKWPTDTARVYRDDADYQTILEDHVKKLSAQQQLLYASGRYAVLLIFQAMDAAGKDGVIAHVMSGVNPQGCQVFSFKHPSATELKHDFLWRTTVCLPEQGKIGIFNRSYYEEVLIVRVHPEILRAEDLPESAEGGKAMWAQRYQSIVDLERHLGRNGTRIMKFFLHLSKEEQRKRFLARIDAPDKNWKFSESDIEERKYWKEYKKAYEKCLERHQYARGAVVRRARGRQAKRPPHRLPHRARYHGGSEALVPPRQRRPAQGTAEIAQAIGEVISRVPAARSRS